VQQPAAQVLILPGLGKGPHILKVTSGEALDLWEGAAEVLGKSVNDFCPPPFSLLTLHDVSADAPVQQNELAVHRKSGPQLSRSNPLLEVLEKSFVVRKWYWWTRLTHRASRKKSICTTIV
jgi:hypothetical protein